MDLARFIFVQVNDYGIGPAVTEEIMRADVDRDGEAEIFNVLTKDSMLYTLQVCEADGSVIWEDDHLATSHPGWCTYLLYEKDGQTTMVRYNPYASTGLASYYYQIFTLENGTENILQEDEVSFELGKPEEYPPELDGFLHDINEIMDSCTILFSTEKGKIVGPIATDVGYHVLLISDIEEAKITPIVDVREDIIKEIKSARAYDLMTEKAKKMDEMIASGSSLEDSAKAVSMKVEKIEAVDSSGVQKNGEKVFFSENTEVLSALLKYKKGAVSPLMAQGTGFILIRTDEITPMALREFEENGVQEILKNAWTTDKQKEGLKAYAEKVFAEVKKGTPIARVAKKYELTEKDYEEVNKRMLSETLGNQSKDLFGLNEGQMTMLPVGNEGYVIVRVLKIKDANPTEDMAIFNLAQRDFQKRIQTLMNESFMASFAKSREVKINDEAIEKVFAPYLAPTEEE